jgi:hypothetical protein
VSTLVRTDPATRREAHLVVGVAAILFPVVYLVSDLVEVAQGDFSVFRLSLTFIGEAGLPFVVVGLVALLFDRLPRWATLGALAYAYSFIFFTSTVVWAIVAGTPSWETLGEDFGWWMTVHGAVMVAGGIAFGIGVALSGVLPPWTGWGPALGVVLVAGASGMGNLERTLAAAVPDVAFAGMGIALLHRPWKGIP